jgi:ParB-like chromosome segregation protein Spo0J
MKTMTTKSSSDNAEFRSPVYNIKSIPVEKLRANEYNPNRVAPPEMKLLYDSIKEDGYTMPIVVYYHEKDDMYEIVDGFHRYSVMLQYKDIYNREGGKIPCSIIEKPIGERMASTIRHNRARGTHNVDLMSNIIAELSDMGKSDRWIAQHLGMSEDEILRLKQITGLAALFEGEEFSQSWVV